MNLAALIIVALGFAYLLLALLERRRTSGSPRQALPGIQQRSLDHGRRQRHYLLAVPEILSSDAQPRPLVIVLHGGGGHAQAMLRRTALHQSTLKRGWIAAFPEGTGRGQRLNWNAGSVPPQGYAEERSIDDVGFLKQLIQVLKQELPIDTQRIYLVGLSKGGMLAYRFACEEARMVAAIAVVSATLTYPRCRPRWPVSVLHIHGDGDENVPLRGGKGRYTAVRNQFPPVWDGIGLWLEVNGCRDEPQHSSPSADSSCWHYSSCHGQLETVFCLIRGSGHGWPGSGGLGATGQPIPVSQTFNATELICQFFERHSSADRKAKSDGSQHPAAPRRSV